MTLASITRTHSSGGLRLRDALLRLDHRPALPGEHWAAFGAGTVLLGWGTGARSPLVRGIAWAVGALLLVRAIGGRDGPIARLQRSRRRASR